MLLPALLVSAIIGGCDEPSGHRWEKMRRPPEHWLDVALEAENADERRRAVDALADSRAGTSDWAVRAFETIARTDGDAMVRTAALRGLRRSAGPQTVPLLVKLLRQGDAPPDVRAAPAPVRWEATRLLCELCASGCVTSEQADAVVELLLHRATLDTDRNVRLCAIRALASFRQRRVVATLIGVLRERDFALQSAAEHSLGVLTGRTHDFDADAWSDWLNASGDPFAGSLPPAAAVGVGAARG